MRLLPEVRADDRSAVRLWFERLAQFCRDIDYEGGREIFAEDMIAFGTFTDFMRGRELTEHNQWRNVWGTIKDFCYDLDTIDVIIAGDRLTAVGMGLWQSQGFHPDGEPFDRPGRTTVVLIRRSLDEPFVAVHTHMSLFRGTPDRSFGDFA